MMLYTCKRCGDYVPMIECDGPAPLCPICGTVDGHRMTPRATPPTLTMLSPDDPEWERAWQGLEAWSKAQLDPGTNPAHACDCDTPHRCAATPYGETWQYLGTVGGLYHEFRHRDWPPRTSIARPGRTYVRIPTTYSVGVKRESFFY